MTIKDCKIYACHIEKLFDLGLVWGIKASKRKKSCFMYFTMIITSFLLFVFFNNVISRESIWKINKEKGAPVIFGDICKAFKRYFLEKSNMGPMHRRQSLKVLTRPRVVMFFIYSVSECKRHWNYPCSPQGFGDTFFRVRFYGLFLKKAQFFSKNTVFWAS
jgi:hypothetical protein